MLDNDDTFDALAHEQRRGLLLALLENSPRGVRIGPSEDAADTPSRENRIALHHTHLPKLADLGVVKWDRGRNRVFRGPRFEEIESLLLLITSNREELSDGRMGGRVVTDAHPVD